MTKTALITGASRGIGRATARRLATSDLGLENLVLVARDSEDFHATVAEIGETFEGNVEAHTVDMGDRAAVIDLARAVYEAHGGVDILVNNAGYTNPVAIHQIDFADFERTMAVNLYAPFTLIQELLRRGNVFESIVNVASTAGIKGRSGWLTYSASKAALINMSDVLREELSLYGTRVICISPGRTATDLRVKLAPDEDPQTIMQPEHVARVIHMMLEPVGEFIDSENLVVRQ